MSLSATPLSADAVTLLNLSQHDFPLTPRPFAALADRMGLTEDAVLALFGGLREDGVLGRIGAIYQTGAVGSSCLAAISVPPEAVEAAATAINSHPEVNHNYLREHPVNLWFVVVAPTEDRRQAVLDSIAADTGAEVLSFPMIEGYHLDLGFPLATVPAG